jgi:hypothetical protein
MLYIVYGYIALRGVGNYLQDYSIGLRRKDEDYIAGEDLKCSEFLNTTVASVGVPCSCNLHSSTFDLDGSRLMVW